MRSLSILAAIGLLAPLILAADCPDQQYLPLTVYSIQLDVDQIALGPADANGIQRPLLLRPPIVVTLGQAATDKLRACDPDGDPLQVRCQDGTLVAEPNKPERYRWTWTPTAVGVTYHWIEATDERPQTNDSITTRGTLVVVCVPRNRPPSLCGGQP